VNGHIVLRTIVHMCHLTSAKSLLHEQECFFLKESVHGQLIGIVIMTFSCVLSNSVYTLKVELLCIITMTVFHSTIIGFCYELISFVSFIVVLPHEVYCFVVEFYEVFRNLNDKSSLFPVE